MSDFEGFAADPANRAAAAAARAVADASGTPFAPLLVVGARGSGKSELLHAIAERLSARHPRASLELLGGALLAERFRAALLAGEGAEFRARLVEADLLLVDDLEQLAGQADCQGLLAELLDARRAAGRETVLTASRPLAELAQLDARLARRLGEGATVPLVLPGAEARLTMLRRQPQAVSGQVPDPVVRAVAAAQFASLRDYSGALSRLAAFQEASPVPLSPDDALVLIGAVSAVSAVSEVSEVGGVGRRSSPSSLSPASPPTSPSPPASPPSDEFADFLSDVTAGVSEQVDRWRRRIGEAVLRWGAEGLRTRRLEALLEHEMPADPEAMLSSYERDARELLALAREAIALAPDLAGIEVLRDPDQLAAARATVAEARNRIAPLSAPLAQYRFEDLAEGPTTRLVMLAARDIVADPGGRYSPLLVVGGPGTGKSHLVHALGNGLAARGVGPIACLGAPAFAAEVRGLGDAEALAAWRQRYRWVGALLLDDLHLLSEERRAQEELALLLAELVEGRRQMVFASGRPLEQLAGFDTRLGARLSSGLLVELPPPDRAVRLAVVKRLLAGSPAAQDAALADYLAARPAESIREVQGMVQRVLEAAASQGVSASPTLAREVLEALAVAPARPPRRSGAHRASGVLSPGLGLVKSREKMIMDWPDLADRLLAELGS